MAAIKDNPATGPDPGSGSGAWTGAQRLLRVLVVEDDNGDYQAIARALRDMVHFQAAVTRAKTLEGGRKLVQQHGYDVVLVDFNLGPDCGARLLQDIGGRASGIAPILLTGLLEKHVLEAALEAGAILCLNKSDLSPTLLETTLRSVLHTRHVEAEVGDLVDVVSSGSAEQAIAALLQLRARLPRRRGAGRLVTASAVSSA